jgi:Thioredoxin reductase
LATGLIDQLPPLPGIELFYGKSAFHCPYCDGWELGDQPLAVYGKGKRGYQFSLNLLQWSRDIALCSNGALQLEPAKRRHLEKMGVKIFEQKILRLDGRLGRLRRILFKDGTCLERRALFFNTLSYQRSPLAASLGCAFNRKGGVQTYGYGATNVPGLYAAGNILRDVQLVIVAAGDGASAAFEINSDLCQTDTKALHSGPSKRSR